MNPLHPLELYVNKAPQEQSSRVEIKKLKNFFRENVFCFRREHIELLKGVRKALPLRQANLIKKINKIIVNIYCFDEKEERSISFLHESFQDSNLINLTKWEEISDNSIERLKELSFEFLDLQDCRRITEWEEISDNSIEHLKELSNLESLNLQAAGKLQIMNAKI